MKSQKLSLSYIKSENKKTLVRSNTLKSLVGRLRSSSERAKDDNYLESLESESLDQLMVDSEETRSLSFKKRPKRRGGMANLKDLC